MVDESLKKEHRENLLWLKGHYAKQIKSIGKKVTLNCLRPLYREHLSTDFSSSGELSGLFVDSIIQIICGGYSERDLLLYYEYGATWNYPIQRQAIQTAIDVSEEGKIKNADIQKAKESIINAGQNNSFSSQALQDIFSKLYDLQQTEVNFTDVEKIVSDYISSVAFKKNPAVAEWYTKISEVDEKIQQLDR